MFKGCPDAPYLLISIIINLPSFSQLIFPGSSPPPRQEFRVLYSPYPMTTSYIYIYNLRFCHLFIHITTVLGQAVLSKILYYHNNLLTGLLSSNIALVFLKSILLMPIKTIYANLTISILDLKFFIGMMLPMSGCI